MGKKFLLFTICCMACAGLFAQTGRSTAYLQDSVITVDVSGNKVSKSEVLYDNRGNITLEGRYNWDINLNDWVGIFKREQVYDNKGNQTLFAEFYWDSNRNDWAGYNKGESAYDENGNRTSGIRYNWDNDSEDWIEEYKYEYVYDDKGNQTSSIQYHWDNDSEDYWIEKYEYFMMKKTIKKRCFFVIYGTMIRKIGV